MVEVQLVSLHVADVFPQDAHQRPQLTLQGNSPSVTPDHQITEINLLQRDPHST